MRRFVFAAFSQNPPIDHCIAFRTSSFNQCASVSLENSSHFLLANWSINPRFHYVHIIQYDFFLSRRFTVKLICLCKSAGRHAMNIDGLIDHGLACAKAPINFI